MPAPRRIPRLPRNFTLCFVCALVTAALALALAAARTVGPA